MSTDIDSLFDEANAVFKRYEEQTAAVYAKHDESRPLSRWMMKDIVLDSDVGNDYSTLHSMLLEGRFRQADKLTYDLMCKAVGKPIGSYFASEDTSYFPDSDLLSIERLWNYYGNGKFGFDVQREIYRDHASGDLDQFKQLVGWKGNVFQSYDYPEDCNMLDEASHGFLPYLCNHKGKVLFIKNQIIVHEFINRLDMILPVV